MVDSFGLPTPADASAVYAAVVEVLQHAVYHHTHLFYGRHIDQVMLSALYGYCKVHKLAKSFSEITTIYKRQPQASQQVSGDPRGEARTRLEARAGRLAAGGRGWSEVRRVCVAQHLPDNRAVVVAGVQGRAGGRVRAAGMEPHHVRHDVLVTAHAS
eukprot:364462-Chlamydomonas_euryale.AAC.1